jgi:hypothetical protein
VRAVGSARLVHEVEKTVSATGTAMMASRMNEVNIERNIILCEVKNPRLKIWLRWTASLLADSAQGEVTVGGGEGQG